MITDNSIDERKPFGICHGDSLIVEIELRDGTWQQTCGAKLPLEIVKSIAMLNEQYKF